MLPVSTSHIFRRLDKELYLIILAIFVYMIILSWKYAFW